MINLLKMRSALITSALVAWCLLQGVASGDAQKETGTNIAEAVREDQVAIMGSGFSGATSVLFNGIAAQFIVVSDSLITARRPPEIKDKAKIEVSTPRGIVASEYSRPLSAVEPLKEPRLVLTSVEPNFGPATGGTVIRIIGTGFNQRGNPRVFLDGLDAAGVSHTSQDELVAITPAHEPGIARVLVKTFDGGEAVLENAFMFIKPPSVTSIIPSMVPTAGGAAITIRGEGFSTSGDVTVTFGGTSAKNVTVKSASEMIVVTPPYVEGLTAILITNPDGQSAEYNGSFAYLTPPKIDSVSSASISNK